MTEPITPDERAVMRERLLDALDTAEDEVLRIEDLDSKVLRLENFLRMERVAARRNLERAERAEAEVKRLREDAETLRGWITEHEETIIETSDALDTAEAEVARLRRDIDGSK